MPDSDAGKRGGPCNASSTTLKTEFTPLPRWTGMKETVMKAIGKQPQSWSTGLLACLGSPRTDARILQGWVSHNSINTRSEIKPLSYLWVGETISTLYIHRTVFWTYSSLSGNQGTIYNERWKCSQKIMIINVIPLWLALLLIAFSPFYLL